MSEVIADFIENSPREVQISQLRAGRRASSRYTEEEDFLHRGSAGLPFCPAEGERRRGGGPSSPTIVLWESCRRQGAEAMTLTQEGL